MSIATSIRSILTALIGASVVASSALGAGEPKNDYPFTRIVGGERTALATRLHVTPSHAVRGEPKNLFPFTRR